MDDWTTSPQFWISSAVSAITGFLLQYLYRLGHSKIQPLLAGAKGQIRTFFRGRRLKDLRRVKAARFHSVRINREIALSYVMLTFFIAMGFLCVISFAFLPADARNSRLLTALYGSITGIPLLIFEFAWLVTSTRVNDMLKYRSRIKRRSRRIC